MAGAAFFTHQGMGTHWILEGPAGQPLRAFPAFMLHLAPAIVCPEAGVQTPEYTPVWCKTDFADQAAVDVYVAARTAPIPYGYRRDNPTGFSNQYHLGPQGQNRFAGVFWQFYPMPAPEITPCFPF